MENVRLNLRQRKGRGLCDLGYSVSVFLDLKYTENGKERSRTVIAKRLYYGGDSDNRDIASKQINQLFVEFLTGHGYDATEFSTRGNIDLKEDIKVLLLTYIREFETHYPFKFTMTDIQPVIIRFEEKHGSLNFIAHSEDEVRRIFKHVLATRWADGWYDWMKNYAPFKLSGVPPGYTSDEIDALPDSMESVKDEMRSKLMEWKKAEDDKNEIRDRYKEIAKVAKSTEINSEAYDIIRDNRGGEYENFEVIEPDEFK